MCPLVNGLSAYFSIVNVSKVPILIDLGQREGKNILERIMYEADILAETFGAELADRDLVAGLDASFRLGRNNFCDRQL